MWKPMHNTGVSTADTTETAKAVVFQPGAKREWKVTSIQVKIVTGSSSVGSAPAIQVRDSAATVYLEIPPTDGPIVAASDAGKYFAFSPQFPSGDTAFAGADSAIVRMPMPELIIPHDWSLRVYLPTGYGGASDSVTVHIMGWQRGTV